MHDYDHIIIIEPMKVIIHEASLEFKSRKVDTPAEQAELLKFIHSHPFFTPELPLPDMLAQIKQKIKQNSLFNNDAITSLQQLGLYLNKANNRLMFQIYEIVLKHPRGITYRDIGKKTKLEIVNISHYCCRLKKMNFVYLRHEKSEKVVYPKTAQVEHRNDDDEDQQRETVDSKPFHFHELSIVDNIWVNVSSMESYQKNGVTNEDIKERLSKTADTKMIMKLMDQVRDIYGYDREMVSEGKVFENRYKNKTKEIMNVSLKPKDEPEITEKLSPNVLSWLQEKYPQFSNEKFLYTLINHQLKDYLSAMGYKSSRRDCTPIKFTRYIKVLNSLNSRWPQTHIELKKFIIDQEKQIPNGTMHKRSIIGILDGMVAKGILRKQEPYYYPMWKPDGEEVDISLLEAEEASKARKKPHLDSIKARKEEEIGKRVNIKQYTREIVLNLMVAELEAIMAPIYKHAFRRILFVKRAKTGIKLYQPETHILHLLQTPPSEPLPTPCASSYTQLIDHIDQFVERAGIKESPIPNVHYDMVKILRKYTRVDECELRGRFGAGWQDKAAGLLQAQVLRRCGEEQWGLDFESRFFI